jgi:Na+/proline symporter
MQSGFTTLDSIVLFAYFIGIVAFGLWVARRIKTSDGYFRGERKFGWWIMMGQAFSTGTHAEMPVAQAGATLQHGFAAIWYQWKNMLITPFYWLLAPWYRRSERTTTGEIVEDRYGVRLAIIYSVFAICYFVFNQGAMLAGAGKMVSVATGDMISKDGVILGMTVAFLLYSFFGGLKSSAYADFVQGILIIVLSFLLIPAGLKVVGGFAGMRETLPSGFFRLYSEESKMTAFMIAMLAVNGIVGITSQPHIMAMCGTGNTERAGRVGQTYGSFVKRICTIGWALTGMIVAAILIQRGIGGAGWDPERAFGFASRELLRPGLTGLMIACVLAANMSTCSTFMVNTGALFTHNFFKKYFLTDATDKQLLWTGRLSGFGLTLLGIGFGVYVQNVLNAFLFTETIAAFMGIIIFGGFLWRRANRYGALASVIVSFGLYYYLNYRGTGELTLLYKWLPEPFGWAMLAGFGALVFFSLITKPEDKDRIDRFFENQNRLSDAPGLKAGEEKPLASEHAKDLLFLDIGGWLRRSRWTRFRHRYKEDVVGFILAWATVGAIVALAWGILQLGR